jgi:hypothetical protein
MPIADGRFAPQAAYQKRSLERDQQASGFDAIVFGSP